MTRRLCALLLLFAACKDDDPAPARTLFDDPKTSSSPSNVFACSTCHVLDSAEPARIRPGYPLGGVTKRTSFWGGQRLDLLEAINDCRLSFMDAPRPWTPDDEDARAMYGLLASSSGASDPLPFDVDASDPPMGGDATRGADVYARACQICHGTLRAGEGKLVPFAPALPVTPPGDRAFYVRRVRRGAFASATGSMPPFSRQALSDEDLSALLAYLGY